MTKETVRYPDAVVDAVEDAVGDGVFESKSEFYRFAAEYLLGAIDPDYEPESYDYAEIEAELEESGGFADAADGEADGEREAFLDAVSEVRKRCFRGEYDAAANVIDARYDSADAEAILLEEFLSQYKVAAATGLNASHAGGRPE